MNFKIIEPVNQIESNLFVRHRVDDMKDGELIQRCVMCGQVVEDYTYDNTVWFGTAPSRKGYGAGYVYINKSGSYGIKISEAAISMGFLSEPDEVIDCTTINS